MKEGQKILVLVHWNGKDHWVKGKFIKNITSTDREYRIDCVCNHPKYGEVEIHGAAPECVKAAE